MSEPCDSACEDLRVDDLDRDLEVEAFSSSESSVLDGRFRRQEGNRGGAISSRDDSRALKDRENGSRRSSLLRLRNVKTSRPSVKGR